MKQEIKENCQDDDSTASSGRMSNRRKLIRGGLIGAPLLLTLKSAPVFANCKLPSGFSVSGNISHTSEYLCDSLTKPSLWTVVSSKYYDSLHSKQTAINQNQKLVGTSAGVGFVAGWGITSNTTFADALASNDSYVRKIAALYLNVVAGNITWSVTNVTDLWNLGYVGGNYSATTGVVWDQVKVKAYLDYLFPSL